jgi:hypothetical protein
MSNRSPALDVSVVPVVEANLSRVKALGEARKSSSNRRDSRIGHSELPTGIYAQILERQERFRREPLASQRLDAALQSGTNVENIRIHEPPTGTYIQLCAGRQFRRNEKGTANMEVTRRNFTKVTVAGMVWLHDHLR